MVRPERRSGPVSHRQTGPSCFFRQGAAGKKQAAALAGCLRRSGRAMCGNKSFIFLQKNLNIFKEIVFYIKSTVKTRTGGKDR